MPLLEWNDRMSVGIAIIDGDHRKLVGMLNALNDAVGSDQNRDMLAKVLRGLVKYTVVHFANEEKLMAEHGYPASPEHQREHADLATKAAAVADQFESGEMTALSMEVLQFLKEWLIHHIQGSDMKLGRHLHSCGVS